MKKFISVMLTATVFWQVNAADSVWLTDLPKAQAQAKAENKIVLVDFSGSDWCPDCIELKKKVFDTKRFQAYAAVNVVLVDVDFPDKKAQSDDLKKSNAGLKDKYGVEGFPTLIVLDSTGKEIGRKTGYNGSSPDAFIEDLEKFKASK
jgi:protein disulfide-isomerase